MGKKLADGQTRKLHPDGDRRDAFSPEVEKRSRSHTNLVLHIHFGLGARKGFSSPGLNTSTGNLFAIVTYLLASLLAYLLGTLLLLREDILREWGRSRPSWALVPFQLPQPSRREPTVLNLTTSAYSTCYSRMIHTSSPRHWISCGDAQIHQVRLPRTHELKRREKNLVLQNVYRWYCIVL